MANLAPEPLPDMTKGACRGARPLRVSGTLVQDRPGQSRRIRRWERLDAGLSSPIVTAIPRSAMRINGRAEPVLPSPEPSAVAVGGRVVFGVPVSDSTWPVGDVAV